MKDILGIGVPDGSLLITLDVWSLYTNIPHYDSIFAFNEAYDDCRFDKPVGGEIFGTLMKLMFDLNNFECDNSHYVQSNGASLSTRVGPNYAKMFMGILEANFIENWHLKQCFYEIFIDDSFIIWSHGEASLLSFLKNFINAHPIISFTHTYLSKNVSCPDVTVRASEGRLSTNLFRKPTDRHQHLLYSHSGHARHCETGIP